MCIPLSLYNIPLALHLIASCRRGDSILHLTVINLFNYSGTSGLILCFKAQVWPSEEWDMAFSTMQKGFAKHSVSGAGQQSFKPREAWATQICLRFCLHILC